MNNGSLSSTAADVWSWRCRREWLEREYQVQERLLRQPHCYSVVLESKMTFHGRCLLVFALCCVIYLCICLCFFRRCCWWMQKSESGFCSLWREHPGSQWMAFLNSTVRNPSVIKRLRNPLSTQYTNMFMINLNKYFLLITGVQLLILFALWSVASHVYLSAVYRWPQHFVCSLFKEFHL